MIEMDYATAYSRASNPKRYGKGDVESMLRTMATDPDHRKPGSTLRVILADALQEEDRHDEAAHMRSKFPVSFRDGKVQTSTLRLHRMLTQMRRYYGGEHIQAGEPSELRLEAAKEAEKIGRHHEAGILRSKHPINTHVNYNPHSDTAPSHTVTGDYEHVAYGGGDIIYPTVDGSGYFCSNCANGENNSESMNANLDPQHDKSWIIDPRHAFVHEEGSPINCDHCHREIPALYGDPDNPEED